MFHIDYEKSEKRNKRRNVTSKSGKNDNARREGKLQIPGNIVKGLHQRWNKKKKKEKSIYEE